MGKAVRGEPGCLPFTGYRTNRSVYGLSKWYAKFRTGKCRPGIPFTICTKQFTVPFTEKQPRWPETGIKDGLNGTRIFLWNIPSGKTGLSFQISRCPRKFSPRTTEKVMFHLLCNRIFRNLFVNSKQPRILVGKKLLWKHEKTTPNKQKIKTTLGLQGTNMGLVAGYTQ